MIADLVDCRVFLENKYINEVFYEALYHGRACIVKSSAKCPWSIGNEYRLSRRIFAEAPDVVAEPLAWEDGRPALIATARVFGPTLTELLEQGLDEGLADRLARDIHMLARALQKTGIVHRDVFSDNLLLDSDGHLKAIDWQLAIDRSDYREDPWVRRHWKFRYVIFGVNHELGLGVWNDFHAFRKILSRFPQTDVVREVVDWISARESEMGFSSPPDLLTRFRLLGYACSLRLQMFLRGRRHRKYRQLENRLHVIGGIRSLFKNCLRGGGSHAK